jgi:hypothetical protein
VKASDEKLNYENAKKIMQMLEDGRENVRRLPHGVTRVPFVELRRSFFEHDPHPLENLGESLKTPILGESGVAEEKVFHARGEFLEEF